MAKDKIKPGPQSALRETFAKFFEDPSRDRLHELLKESGGEFRDLDFKVEWPSGTQVAKQVLGLANIGGGVLVIGVEEQPDGGLTPVGVGTLTDKAVITGWLKGIIPPGLLERVAVHDFSYPSGDYGRIQGMKFQVMFVDPDEDQMPFLPLREANKIVPGTIYIRRDGMVEAASNEEVQKILNTRIERGHSTQPQLDLKSHIDQLKVLYQEISPQKPAELGWLIPPASVWARALGAYQPNELYPKETLEQFISTQISAKKALIRQVLGTDERHN